MLETLAFFLSSAVALPFAAVPQDADNPGQQGPPLVSLTELRLIHYPPQHVSVYDLEQVVTRMVGRQFYVKERGGFAGHPVSNVSVLGDSLILYDTVDYLEVMNQVIPSLDQPGAQLPTEFSYRDDRRLLEFQRRLKRQYRQ